MVLEALISSRDLQKSPRYMLLYSIIVTSVSIWAAHLIFPGSVSIVFLFLITLAFAPVIYKVLLTEAEEAVEIHRERVSMSFYEQYSDVLSIYLYLFIGVLLATAFWFVMLPKGYTASLFDQQIATAEALTGQSLGYALARFDFWTIFMNNLRVSVLAFVVSFLFGTGALFILSWNASVIAAFVGITARNTAAMASPVASHYLASLYGYVYAVPIGLLSISLHGLPEIMAYCLAGISGGLLSAGMMHGQKDWSVFEDTFSLFLANFVILVISALVEVYVTPTVG